MIGHAIGLTGDTTIADWLQLIRGEYARDCRPAFDETTGPGSVGPGTMACDALLNALVDAGFLRRTSDDAYVRDR